MPVVMFPFWVIARRRDGIPLEALSAPFNAASFSSPLMAEEYLRARQFSKEWQIQMITRPTLPNLIEQLTHQGWEGICHDQSIDGGGGVRFVIAELEATLANE